MVTDGVTQPGSRPESRPESQPESSTSPALVQYQSLEERVLTLLGQGALPVSILSRQLGQKRVSGQLKVVLSKLLLDALIEFTIPDKPSSRLQKYPLAPEGEKALTERGGEARK
jgi:ATP-dependent DNA helicase RecG